MKTYEIELPEGYREAKTVDAQNKKLGLLLNLAALAPLLLIGGAVFFILGPTRILESAAEAENFFLHLLVFMGAMIAYIILHELVHGVIYKALTGRKLKFGLTLTVAYCGVPDIYVYRRTALLALAGPLVVFIPVFALPAFLLPLPADQMLAARLLGLHLRGCSGDLYDLWLYALRFKAPETLMRDTGPKQVFYVKD